MRFHVLGLPQVGTTKDYYLCGFVPAIFNFCKMMKELGHYVILYTSEENTAPCDEHVVVITKEEQKKWLGGVHYVFAPFEIGCGMWEETNRRVSSEIGRRKQPKDFACLLGGGSQQGSVAAHTDVMVVEYMVGYMGIFAPYCVFCSHSWRQYIYGRYIANDHRFFDTTIPLYFDPDDFKLAEAKKDFILYAGRITGRKGLDIAVQATQRAGLQLKMIGPGTTPDYPKHVEVLGIVSNEERAKLMGEARAVIAPTMYNEPFGAVVIEANLCGTPAITTDWGAFPELIENGVNGVRCNLLKEFAAAPEACKAMDGAKIRERAIAKYSLEVIKPLYQAYFERLLTLWDKGWYS